MRRVVRERGQPASLRVADDLVADQDVAHAAAHQRLGLADLLAALADRAGARSAAARSSGHLCVLACGRRRDAGAARERRHLVEVVLESVEVDDQRGRVDVVDRRADLGGWSCIFIRSSLANVAIPKRS